jgi:hypothetical protein
MFKPVWKFMLPAAMRNVKIAGGRAAVKLPPLSVAAMTFRLG